MNGVFFFRLKTKERFRFHKEILTKVVEIDATFVRISLAEYKGLHQQWTHSRRIQRIQYHHVNK